MTNSELYYTLRKSWWRRLADRLRGVIMAIPDPLTSKATEPGGVGRTVRCLVVKDGRWFEVHATLKPRDAKTDDVEFPSYLYENGGFTLLGIEGKASIDLLSEN
jgi:hypothetical protein